MQYQIGTGGNSEEMVTVIASRENGKYQFDVIADLLFDISLQPTSIIF